MAELLQTTLCYLERDGCYLMLHRVKKKKDVNRDKWIGVGGKFEPGEDALACVWREVREETGYTMDRPRYRGVLDFTCPPWPPEQIHLFTCTEFSGTPPPLRRGRAGLGAPRTRSRTCPSGPATSCFSACWRRRRRFFPTWNCTTTATH